jgi:putative tryptophan/tyrosine transport system substrate-binding protein
MRRRDVIKLIAGTAVACPLVARAQQSAIPVIGFMHGSSPEAWVRQLAAFRNGLSETGFIEEQNARIEYR